MRLERLGPYRLIKKIGQGGMGAVYQGVDESTGDAAAVKVLSPQLAADEAFRVRFEAEIESLKKLRHPNIVRLLGYGEEQDSLFYAMELVDGTSLEDELRAGRRFDWREVTQLTIKLCRALKHAHDHGVIHRDIKPANLLLSTTGEIKLSDFGIARLFGNTRQTSDGGVLGTAEYMAPEQADGRAVTDRCDQYSLGGVMYALLTGRPPFRGATLMEMLQLQRFAEPDPVRRWAADTPAELDRIILQLLEKDPQKRFSNTLILARALEAMERGLSLSAGREDLQSTRDDPILTGDELDRLGPTITPPPASAADEIGLEDPHDRTAARALRTESETIKPTSGRPAALSDTVGRFTKVKDESGERTTWHQEAWTALASWQTVLAAIGLIGVGSLIWYAQQPPSADRLFTQIDDAAGAHESAELLGAEPDMRRFLKLYPDDPRADKVRLFVAEAEDLRNQRRLEQTARQVNRAAHSAVERAYRDALFYKPINPELAIVKFQALVDLYGRSEDKPKKDDWVRLARDEIKLLEKQIEDDQRDDRETILGQLAEARRLEITQPATAEKIRRAVITLYSDKPWAAPLVDEARRALDGLASGEQPPPQGAGGAPTGTPLPKGDGGAIKGTPLPLGEGRERVK